MVAALPLDLEGHATVRRLGRPALAWEVLRRDPAYCEAFRELSLAPERPGVVDTAFSARWGLHFP